MNNERKILTAVGWKPSDELLQINVERLKNENPDVWEELKKIELRNGDIKNEWGNKLTEIIRNANPDLDTVQIISLRMCIRAACRRENGQIVV